MSEIFNPGSGVVTGTITVVQPTGTLLHVTVDAAPTTAVTGPLTDAQLRATPVPVSGTVATGGLTDAQLRASAVKVDGSGFTQPISAASLPLPSGASTEATLAKLAITQGTNQAGLVGPMVLASVNDSAQSGLEDGAVHPLSMTSAGRLRTETVIREMVDFFGDVDDTFNGSPWGDFPWQI